MSVTTQSGSGRQYVGSGRQYVLDEIKSSVVNMLCVWEPWRILNRKNLIVPLYICSGLLSKLN